MARESSGAPAAAPSRESADRGGARDTLFRPGRNCWQVARANRVGLLVEGAGYFPAFAQAALEARHSILISAWEIHSRTHLHHGIRRVPEELGEFLNFLVRRRRSLHVRILAWDYPLVFAKDREITFPYAIGWKPHRRVHICYDGKVPTGAAHHQKLVVVDGAIGFCGGLDLTRSRWDTSEHRPQDPRRINPGEDEIYAPFHDMMMLVDGEAARALESILRARWQLASGTALPPAGTAADPWPANVPVHVHDVDVAISRTAAAIEERPAV